MTELTEQQRTALGPEWAALADFHAPVSPAVPAEGCSAGCLTHLALSDDDYEEWPCDQYRTLITLADARIALSWYAEAANWEATGTTRSAMNAATFDNGQRARQALGERAEG